MYERKKRPPTKKAVTPLPKARSEVELEKRGVGLATNLAIQQMQEGTASSQIITHFLKIGSLKEQLELKKVEYEIEMLKAKTDAIKSQEQQDKKYDEVMKAIASYAGKDDEWEEVPYDWEG